MQLEIKEVSQGGSILMRDFHSPHVDWGCSAYGIEIQFIDTLSDCALEELVMEPDGVAVILDLILGGTRCCHKMYMLLNQLAEVTKVLSLSTYVKVSNCTGSPT